MVHLTCAALMAEFDGFQGCLLALECILLGSSKS